MKWIDTRAAHILEAIGARRSVRVYRTYRPVPASSITLVLEAARRASHFGNLNAVGAIVVRRERAAPELLRLIVSPTGALALRTAPLILLWTIDKTRIEELGAKQHELVKHGAFGVQSERAERRIEKLLIPVINRRREAIVASGLFELDAGQAIAQATLAATALGLCSCLCALRVSQSLREALRLPEHVELPIAQALGYPLESVDLPPRPRKEFSEVFRDQRYDCPLTPDQDDEALANRHYGEATIEPPAWRQQELEMLEKALGDTGDML